MDDELLHELVAAVGTLNRRLLEAAVEGIEVRIDAGRALTRIGLVAHPVSFVRLTVNASEPEKRFHINGA